MRLLMVLFCFVSFFVPMLTAQTALTGSIHAHLQDPSGRPVVAAEITLRNSSLGYRRSIQPDARGQFTITRLAPSAEYELTVTARGFAEWKRGGLEVLTGETLAFDIDLLLAEETAQITVEAEAGETGAVTEISQTVTRKQLETLPTNGRTLNRFAMLNAHVRNTAGLGGDASNLHRLSINGQIFRDTQYRLDGNSNYDTLFNNMPLQRTSLSAVQEFRVLTNQFSAEHGSTSAGLILATTRSGTNQWHGEGFVLARPSGLQARPPLASVRIPNQLAQTGASLGGPVRTDRTFFFANYEFTDQRRGSLITSPRPDFFVGQFRDHLALVRLDHRFRDSHWLSYRVNGQRDSNNNTNDLVGGLLQPSAAVRSATQSIGQQLTDTVTRGTWVNELRLGYINSVPSNSSPVSPQAVVVRPGFSTEGSARYTMIRNEVYQAADQFSIQRGTHSIKVGGDFIRRKFRDFSYDLFGTYTFAGGAPVAGQQPLLYAQRFGVAQLSYGVTQWAGFAQDTWRATPRLTLNYGLRYDYNSLLDSRANFGPRAGFAYQAASFDLLVRGGVGVYYDQPFQHGLTQRFLLDGPEAPFAMFTLTPADPAFPAFPNALAPNAPPAGAGLGRRNITLRGSRLIAPYTTQFSLGVQKRWNSGWMFSIDGIRSLTVQQFIQFDRNVAAPFSRTAPGQVRSAAAADATRKRAAFEGIPVRQLRETVNGGVGSYTALDVTVSRQFRSRYQLGAHWVWSTAINSVTDDHLGANPQDFNEVVRGERALSDFAQRHRFVANGLVRLPWRMQLSSIATFASGLPVNPLSGVDNNGDGTLIDRAFGFGRNAFRGTRQSTVDVSWSKTVALGERARVELRGDVFNLFNGSNFHRFNNVYGNGAAPLPVFLRPLGGVANADPGRQFTFGARILF